MKGENSTPQYERQRNIRLTAAQDDRLEEIAMEEQMPVSVLIRRTLVQSLFLPRDVKKTHNAVLTVTQEAGEQFNALHTEAQANAGA